MIDNGSLGGWFDPDEWYRDGRGRTWAFSLPTETILRAIELVAAALGDQFDLIACGRNNRAGQSRSIFEVQPPSALSFGSSWQYFIRSRAISPTLPDCEPLPGVGWPAVFSVNGLVILDHPFPSKADPSTSRIGIVHRVRHCVTGERIEHNRYEQVFMALKQSLAAEPR